jgi:hypothetical protein
MIGLEAVKHPMQGVHVLPMLVRSKKSRHTFSKASLQFPRRGTYLSVFVETEVR